MVLRRLPACADHHRPHREPDDRQRTPRCAGSSQQQNQKGPKPDRQRDDADARQHPLAAALQQQHANRPRGCCRSLTGTDPPNQVRQGLGLPELLHRRQYDWVGVAEVPRRPARRYYPRTDQNDPTSPRTPASAGPTPTTSACSASPPTCRPAPASPRAPSNTKVTAQDQQTRLYFQADSTVYIHSAGGATTSSSAFADGTQVGDQQAESGEAR